MNATIKFDDGKEVELSVETTKKLRNELVKPEHVWKHGDVAISMRGDECIRLFLESNLELRIFSKRIFSNRQMPFHLGSGIQQRAKDYNYKYLGNIFDGTYKP